ncbi:uncharacterized protein LOC103362980 isoform X3 [Stegastes partitus]|uniref:Uncharacterized protein LOC103361981 isoform X3 n=1 Tax=Stegastes partitus TaxID=144197 RepID=A0A9Y4K6V0_9TELE|nr:PREDICTED: uncharacterized protein LOC103361981 isoform X3 [Stegastes partitus]XP_008287763.1 PREDICTED: uncharacterized protein LOC103362980 isoform X3 [Stegastes partitus]
MKLQSLPDGHSHDISHHLRLCPDVDKQSGEQRFTDYPSVSWEGDFALWSKEENIFRICSVDYSTIEPLASTFDPQTHRQFGDTSCSPPQPPEDTDHAEKRKLQVSSSVAETFLWNRQRERRVQELREHLKRQIEEKCAALKLQLSGKVKEAEYLREVDRLALSSEREQRIQHSRAMAAYRDENKRLMEQSWRDRALTRSQEVLKERELLRLNPINWSGTLK